MQNFFSQEHAQGCYVATFQIRQDADRSLPLGFGFLVFFGFLLHPNFDLLL